MAIEYQEVTPTSIPNTVMKTGYYNGVHKVYTITPIEGYVLHDKARDWQGDPVIGEENRVYRGFGTTVASCGPAYDFSPVEVQYIDANGITVTVTAYGAGREFFAIPADSAPADKISATTPTT